MTRITSLSRRRFLATSATGGALLAPSWHASAQGVGSTAHIDPDGPSVPFPIPWLDKNGSHNQRQDLTRNRRTFTISKVEWPGAQGSMDWAPMVRASDFCSAPRRPTTALWM